jgi:hypothetical protein
MHFYYKIFHLKSWVPVYTKGQELNYLRVVKLKTQNISHKMLNCIYDSENSSHACGFILATNGKKINVLKTDIRELCFSAYNNMF